MPFTAVIFLHPKAVFEQVAFQRAMLGPGEQQSGVPSGDLRAAGRREGRGTRRLFRIALASGRKPPLPGRAALSAAPVISRHEAADMRRDAKRLSGSFGASECEMLDGGAAIRLEGDAKSQTGFCRCGAKAARPSARLEGDGQF